jgi:SNF2 family DNA or RNA helicase
LTLLESTSSTPVKRWRHQQEALDRMTGREAFALFMDMRTGKTKVILDEWAEMVEKGQVGQLLVVAPAGVYRTWEVAIRDHLPADLLRRTVVATWASGAGKKAADQLKFDLGRQAPKVLLVNVEALSTATGAERTCLDFVRAAPTVMVVDESTTIKEPSSKRTKACLRLAELVKVKRILSGLPSPQSPLDLYSQFRFLDPSILGHHLYASFRARYAKMVRKPFGPGGRMIEVVGGYQNLDELQRKIEPAAFRVRLDECYDLPPKMYLRRDVEMTEEQKKIYADMKNYAVASLEKEERVTATIVLVQMLRLHQVLAGHVKTDDGVEVDVPENKTKEMLDILEYHPSHRKAIVWVAYDRSVRKVCQAIRAKFGIASVARFWGGNPDSREAEEKLFLRDPKCRFMVATASSGGRGRTWANADLVIYFSNTHSLEHRLQSEERVQAVDKTVSVAYFDLVCPGTVEEKMLHALRGKMNLSDAVTGDNWREWVC